MAGLAKWLAENRLRRVVFIAGFFPIVGLNLLSGATVTMAVQVHGPRAAVIDCALALALLLGMTLLTGMQPVVLAGSAVVSWAIWLFAGDLAGRSGSLTLAVQALVVMALVATGLFVLLVGDSQVFWTDLLRQVYADLAEQGFAVQADIEAQAGLMTGVVVSGSLVGAIVVLLLGSAWAGRVLDGAFAERFRALRLGYALGGAAALAGIAGMLGLQLAGVLLVFGAAFMFQGFAVSAWWSARLGWPRGWWLGFVILPLFMPDLLMVIAMLFAAIGFVDNWYGLRRTPGGT